ncbi:MAG: acyl-CoA dehydrogenase family protein [Alphaproteobacteria bacterium]|nr:acyl-CoA dehydrogenase family protein [Alphaproteobacteria bacterium]
MDFEDSPEEAAFRKEVRAWLDANAKKREGKREIDPEDMENGAANEMAASKAWQKTKAKAGYARITWPKGMGGIGGTPMQSIIFSQEESKYDVAGGGPFAIGLGMCIPTLMAYGDEEAKKRYVWPAVQGDEIWCQLFSEPAGGSDVANLRTKAEKNADGTWTINGSKIWTTGAQFSDYGIILTRTDPNVPKHKGLTMFYINMKDPGVDIRPIKQASGGSGFNEIFFTDIKVKDNQRLGAVGQGWTVALTTLMHERLAVGGGTGGGLDVPQLMQLARTLELEDGPAIKNAAVREKIADWYVRSAGLRYTTFRTMTALSQGKQPGPEASIAKIVVASKLQDLSAFAMDLEGEAGILQGNEAPMGGAFQGGWLSSPGLRIAGGTDEILRNIIAERVLGLPGDIRVDKDVPFNKIPTGR